MGDIKVLRTKPDIERQSMLDILDETRRQVEEGFISSIALVVVAPDGSTFHKHSPCDYAAMIGAITMCSASMSRAAIEEGE